jgi:hypothetical protein
MSDLRIWVEAQILANRARVELWKLVVPQEFVGQWPLRNASWMGETPVHQRIALMARQHPHPMDAPGLALFAYDEDSSEARERVLLRFGHIVRPSSPVRHAAIDFLLSQCEVVARHQRFLQQAEADIARRMAVLERS